MGRKRRYPRNIAKGTLQGKKLSEDRRAAIIQVYAMTGNKEETGRITGVTAKTVRKVISEESTAVVQMARAKAAVELSEKVHLKATGVINAITPEKLDNSSASQLAVVGGILIDKLPVLERYRGELLQQNTGSAGMPMPDDVVAMVRAVASKIKSIDVLHVELRDEDMERELRSARELLEKAKQDIEQQDVIEADYEVLDHDNASLDK